MPENLRAKIQPILDELLSEELIPFALTAYGLQPNGHGEYLIAFNDSRIRSCRFSWKEGEDFKAVVREAVLHRVNKMSGPLTGKLRAQRQGG